MSSKKQKQTQRCVCVVCVCGVCVCVCVCVCVWCVVCVCVCVCGVVCGMQGIQYYDYMMIIFEVLMSTFTLICKAVSSPLSVRFGTIEKTAVKYYYHKIQKYTTI